MRTIKTFENFKNSKYDPDYDNIIQIMKSEFGYGDLPYMWFEEFEDNNKNEINSDEEYSKLLHLYIQETPTK